MFGRHHQPPKPPDHEPWILVVLAGGITGVLTLGYRPDYDLDRRTPEPGHAVDRLVCLFRVDRVSHPR